VITHPTSPYKDEFLYDMSVKNILEKFDDRIVKAVTIIATTSLSVTCIVTLLQVFLRRVFNSPIVWAEDLAVFIFIWITFLGAAILFQKKALISVDSFAAIPAHRSSILVIAIL
jgi:TRAP-type C4-dicarboxylate transport system permease small subunit